MDKNGFINKLKELNKKHNSWYASAEAIIMIVETESDNVPKSYTDCEIGNWFYGEGYQLSKFETFKEIEHIHIELHRLYLEIYKAKRIYDNFKIRDKKKYHKEQKDNLLKLKRISIKLVDKIEDFITEIRKMTDVLFTEKYLLN